MRARDHLTLGIGAAALLASILCVGGAVRWGQALVAALVAGALATQIGSRRRFDRRSPLVLLIAVAIGLTFIQLLPLPTSVLSFFNETGEGLRSDGAELANTQPWRCISLDPPATFRMLAFFTVLLGVAILALRIATSERGRFALLSGVAGACGLAALITGIHEMLSLDALFGLYTPIHASPPVLGPLLNSNHLGCLMAVGAVLSIGLAFHSRQSVHLQVFWIVNAIGCSIVVFASLSRGATLALLLGSIVTLGTWFAGRLSTGSRRRRRSRLRADLPMSIVIVLGLGLAVFSSAGKVADQLDNTSLTELDMPVSKYAAWRASFDLVQEAPVFGIGRGATEPVFTRIFEASGQVTFSHLENEYIQAVVEWGIPGTIVLAILFGWCAYVGGRRWRDGPLASAALGALAGVLFQSSVDFGVELFGLALPVTIVAATLLYGPLTTDASPWSRSRRIALTVLIATAAIALMSATAHTVEEDHDDLADNASESEIQAAIARHPLDYFAFGQEAGVLAKRGDAKAVKFLSHALALHPTHPGLHRIAARLLAQSKRQSQAAIEFALAMNVTEIPYKLLEEITTLLPDVAVSSTAIPLDYPRQDLVIRSLKELKRTDVAIRWLKRVIAEPQKDTDTIDKLYNLALDNLDYSTAAFAANERFKLAKTNTTRLMLAKVLFRQKDFDGVLAQLRDVPSWKGATDEQAQAWLLTCDVQVERRAWDPALECLHKLEGSSCATSGTRDDVAQRVKTINEQRGMETHQQMLDAMKKAVEQHPQKLAPTPPQ